MDTFMDFSPHYLDDLTLFYDRKEPASAPLPNLKALPFNLDCRPVSFCPPEETESTKIRSNISKDIKDEPLLEKVTEKITHLLDKALKEAAESSHHDAAFYQSIDQEIAAKLKAQNGDPSGAKMIIHAMTSFASQMRGLGFVAFTECLSGDLTDAIEIARSIDIPSLKRSTMDIIHSVQDLKIATRGQRLRYAVIISSDWIRLVEESSKKILIDYKTPKAYQDTKLQSVAASQIKASLIKMLKSADTTNPIETAKSLLEGKIALEDALHSIRFLRS